jgi:beta-galactosidase/beta-glucuronidase
VNLNGLWDIAVLPESSAGPSSYSEQILVPFPVESALSGLARTVGPQERVWYRRTFALPSQDQEGPRWVLHFGAVDWEAEVFLNGASIGTHRGGYDPFSFDITDELRAGGEQELVVSVWDPTDQGNQPRGKQVLDPRGIWYTAVSGIWQTVWLEPVPAIHVENLEITPRLDFGTVEIEVSVTGSPYLVPIEISVLADDAVIAAKSGLSGKTLSIPIPEPRAWSPTDPFLYGVRVEVPGNDAVNSYFGMRSVTLELAHDGHQRLFLNGEPLFQYGTLDQGWWPDGLYTAPTDEALRFDVEKTKDLGFNLIRKHVRV